jgi:hypothetical protein
MEHPLRHNQDPCPLPPVIVAAPEADQQKERRADTDDPLIETLF